MLRRWTSLCALVVVIFCALAGSSGAQRFSLRGGPSPTVPPFASPTIGAGPVPGLGVPALAAVALTGIAANGFAALQGPRTLARR